MDNVLELAKFEFECKNYKKALSYCERLLEQDINNYSAWRIKALCLEQLDTYNNDTHYECYNSFSKALKIIENSDYENKAELLLELSIELGKSVISFRGNRWKVVMDSYDDEPEDCLSDEWEQWREDNDNLEQFYQHSLSFLNDCKIFINISINYLKTYGKNSDMKDLISFSEEKVKIWADYCEGLGPDDEFLEMWIDMVLEHGMLINDYLFRTIKLFPPKLKKFNNRDEEILLWKKLIQKRATVFFENYPEQKKIVLKQIEDVKKEQDTLDSLTAGSTTVNLGEINNSWLRDIANEYLKIRIEMNSLGLFKKHRKKELEKALEKFEKELTPTILKNNIILDTYSNI